MIEAIRAAGPPMLTLLIVLFSAIAIAKAPEIRSFWSDAFGGGKWD